METLVIVAQHKNQYCDRNRSACGLGRLGSFISPPSKDFQTINYRSYHQSDYGLLPTPVKAKSCATPATKRAFSGSVSPKTPSPYIPFRPEEPKHLTKWARSSEILVPVNMKRDMNDDFHYSELWAGPAYSNSPPPSSLPMPKFSMKPKRTVSLELPISALDVDLRPIVKSAPASPTGERSLMSRDFFDDADSATKTLRRILNLDAYE